MVIMDHFSFTDNCGEKLIAERIPYSSEWDITGANGEHRNKLNARTMAFGLNNCGWTEVTKIDVQDARLDEMTRLKLAFFQAHIDAMQENLESLQAAFTELKREVRESI